MKKQIILKIIFFVLVLFFLVAPILGAEKYINYDIEKEISKNYTEIKQTETATVTLIKVSSKQNKTKNIKWRKGYTNTKVYIKAEPNKSSEKLRTIKFNKKIKYHKYNKKWAIVKYKNIKGYIALSKINNKPVQAKTYKTPASKIISWMPYTAITNQSSKQFKLQQKAYTGKFGIRQVNGRYCIAVGSYYTTKIGTYIDLILENGTVIPCILADCKADMHTDQNNILTFDGSLAEFIVDSNKLSHSAMYTGDIHNVCKRWQSNIVKIKLYKKVEKIK